MEIILWATVWIIAGLLLFIPFVILLSGVLVFINSVVDMFRRKA